MATLNGKKSICGFLKWREQHTPLLLLVLVGTALIAAPIGVYSTHDFSAWWEQHSWLLPLV